MKRITLSVLAVPLAILSSTVYAGSDSGFYVGASVGSAQIDYTEDDPVVGDIDFDDDDAGYKIFGGYNIGIIPIVDVAVEVAYVDFGTFDGAIDTTKSELEVDGYTGAALAGVNLGPVGLFLKAGVISWDGDISTAVGGASEDGTDPLYGIGAKFQLSSFQVRAEYELYDLDEIDVDYFSLGAAYTF